ncbi:MAG: DUF2505 domain-containing protein [Mycobacteriales bacterium]
MGTRFLRSVASEVDVETVFAVLSGEHWADQKARYLGDGSRLLRREVTPEGGVTLVMSRELPSGVPAFLQRFLPADRRVTTTDVWGPLQDGARRGTWKAEIAGAPAKLSGTMRIDPTPEGNQHTIEGEVKVSVPLIGGKTESFIAEQVVRLADAEAEVVRKILS